MLPRPALSSSPVPTPSTNPNLSLPRRREASSRIAAAAGSQEWTHAIIRLGVQPCPICQVLATWNCALYISTIWANTTTTKHLFFCFPRLLCMKTSISSMYDQWTAGSIMFSPFHFCCVYSQLIDIYHMSYFSPSVPSVSQMFCLEYITDWLSTTNNWQTFSLFVFYDEKLSQCD